MKQMTQTQKVVVDLVKAAEQMPAEKVLDWCEEWLLDNADAQRLADLVETILGWDPRVRDELEYRQQVYDEEWD